MLSALLTVAIGEIRRRWQVVRATGDAGYSTETVLITALLVALGLAVVAIIAAKVTAKANNINLG